MPQSRLDRHERPSGAQQASGLAEARTERALECEMMQNQAVEDYVEGIVWLLELPGATNSRLVRAPRRAHSGHPVGVRIDRHQPEGGRGEEMASRMPSTSHRHHVAAGDAKPPLEKQPLSAHHVAVVDLQRRLPTQPVEQVLWAVGLGACGP
jgi:hypothetical protein